MPARNLWPCPRCPEWGRWPAQDPLLWATATWQGPCCLHHRWPSRLPPSPAMPPPPMGHPRPTQPRGCRCYGPLAWGSMGSPTPGTPKVSPGATCSLCAHVCAPPPCDHHCTAQTGVWFLRACARRQLLPGLPRPGGLSGASPSQDSPAPDRGRGEGGARRGHVSRRGGGEGGV